MASRGVGRGSGQGSGPSLKKRRMEHLPGGGTGNDPDREWQTGPRPVRAGAGGALQRRGRVAEALAAVTDPGGNDRLNRAANSGDCLCESRSQRHGHPFAIVGRVGDAPVVHTTRPAGVSRIGCANANRLPGTLKISAARAGSRLRARSYASPRGTRLWQCRARSICSCASLRPGPVGRAVRAPIGARRRRRRWRACQSRRRPRGRARTASFDCGASGRCRRLP